MSPTTPAEAPAHDAGMPRMSLGEHLRELRRRFLKCALAMFVTMGASFWFWDEIQAFVMEPYKVAARSQGLASAQLAVISPGDGFVVVMKLCFLVGLVAAAPVLLWQMWQFVAAGLYDKEKRAVRIFFPIGLVLFVLGLVTAYTVLIPIGLSWLMGFNAHALHATTNFSIDAYTSMLVSLVLCMGLAFQLPLVLLFLQGSGLVQRDTLVKGWRYAVVGSFITGMVLTADPSPVTQTLMALPLCGLWFLGVWGGRFVGAGKEQFRWWKGWPLYLGLGVFLTLLYFIKELTAFWRAL